MLFPNIRAAVFDFDGTLFDASDAICHSLNAALTRHGRAPLPRAEILPRIGRPLYEIFQDLDSGASAEKVESYIAAYREAFYPVAVSHTRALPGLAECLGRLHGRVGLGIATNRTERGARQILEGFGFGTHFSVIVALEHVRRVKPDPESVLQACARLQIAPALAVMVGDTPDDVRAGRAAGATAIGVATGVHDRPTLLAAGAHAVLDSLAELPAMIHLSAG